jgi:D-glycero-alpha-D-manno-heptose-7-phosphate kinase
VIICRSPHRISCLGGSSDLPEFLKKQDGLVVGFAIDQYTYTLARKLPEVFPYKSQINYSQRETVTDNKKITHPLIREVITLLRMQSWRLEVSHLSDIPAGSGTGSSSAFATSLINALSHLKGSKIYEDKEVLAKAAIEVERYRLKESGGLQDQCWSSFGGLNAIRFHKREFSVEPILLSPWVEEDFLAHICIFYTNVQRNSYDVSSTYTDIRRVGARNVILAEKAIEAIHKHKFAELGSLLQEAWQLKKDLSAKVSNDSIDELVKTGLESGALGCKLMGSGGGGFLLFVVDPSKRKRLKAALPLVEVPFKIDHEGSKIL